MHFRLQVLVVADDGTEHCQELTDLVRPAAPGEAIRIESLGLTLSESKSLLRSLQEIVVQHQVNAYLDQVRPCPHCGKRRALKENHTAPFRTLFGVVAVPNPRWRHCECREQAARTLRPLGALLDGRTSPELLYLETKWASLASYGVTTKLLHEVLPIHEKHSRATVRNHLLAIAQRQEQAMGAEEVCFARRCQAEIDLLPQPDGPLCVGLDGAIVRGRRAKAGEKAPTLFEVIAGKSLLSFRRDDPEGVPGSSKCFALVQPYDKKPRRRLFDLLESQGMQANQQVTFFSDGGDTVRRLPRFLHPDSEHILDWFHITMRLTVLAQCARGLQTRTHGLEKPAPTSQGEAGTAAPPPRSWERRLESVKHYLWHGNATAARDVLENLIAQLEGWDEDEEGNRVARPDSESAARMLKYARELATYLAHNVGFLVNYGERYRSGERISTAFVESTVNHVVSRRMVKKQQMQWTPRGAHLLLQVRTQVLNDDWENSFRRWYPGFRPGQSAAPAAVSALSLAA